LNPFRRNNTPQQIGADAARLLSDELYTRSFAEVEEEVKACLLGARIESAADKERVVELVRRWQSIIGAKKWLDNQVQYDRLAESRENKEELRKIR